MRYANASWQRSKALDEELPRWMLATSVRASCPVKLIPESVSTLPHVRERFFDPADHLPPEPLVELADDAVPILSLELLRSQGGPVLRRIQEALAAADRGCMPTAGSIFEAMADDARRPVEVLGLVHLLACAAVLDAAQDHEPVVARRTDGSTRELTIPRLTLTDEQLTLIEQVEVR